MGHLLNVKHVLRECLDAQKRIVVVNKKDNGFVTLFRCYPEGVDAKAQYEKEYEIEDASELEKHNKFTANVASMMQYFQTHRNGSSLSYTSNFKTN